MITRKEDTSKRVARRKYEKNNKELRKREKCELSNDYSKRVV